MEREDYRASANGGTELRSRKSALGVRNVSF